MGLRYLGNINKPGYNPLASNITTGTNVVQYQGIFTLQQQLQAQTTQQWVIDPLFDYSTLLLQADGIANGSQNNTFLDSSTNNFTITRNGNTTQGTFSPFSATGWSNYLGSGNYLSAAHNTALDVWVGDFTVEAFVWSNANQTDYTGIVTKASPTSGAMTSGWQFCVVANKINVEVSTGLLFTHSTTLPNNSWAHVVLVKSGSAVSLFQNGDRVATITNSSSYGNTASGLLIGVDRSLTFTFNGYISNVRVVKGGAVYDPTQSTLTVPTTSLTAVTNTSLLTCQSNRFVDNSSNAFALTVTGTPSVQAFSPFAPQFQYTATGTGGSGYFDGNGDELSMPDNAAWDLAANDFTIEAWVYCTSFAGDNLIASQWGGSGNAPYIFRVYSSGRLGFTWTIGGGGGNDAQATSTLVVRNSWNHVAVTRSGGTLYFFVNGVRDSNTPAISGAITNGTNPLWVGSIGGSAYFSGYISSWRFIRGQALSTTTFTPPTAPVNATQVGWNGSTASITGTVSGLLNFTNAGIRDATLKNDLETAGNASVNTTIVKYGSGSMAFNGTANNYLQCTGTNPQFAMGTGDWTVEAWVYPTANNTSIFDTQAVGGGSVCIRLRINSSNQLSFFVTSSEVTAGGLVPLNTWTHVAACKSNGSLRLFVNGAQVNTTYADSNNYTCGLNRPCIGADGFATNSLNFNGYIDDLRVTKGIARYTGTFTPPTVALPRQ